MKSETLRAREAGFAPNAARAYLMDMTDRPKRPKDANQLAKFIVDLATGEATDDTPEKAEAQRQGGIKGGKARAEKLSAEERGDIARKAAATRWNKPGRALGAEGDEVKMTSISPNLTRLKEGGDIVRDDLKVALADRAPRNTEAPEDDLLGRNSPEASNDHGVTDRGTQPSSPVKPWAGGGG